MEKETELYERTEEEYDEVEFNDNQVVKRILTPQNPSVLVDFTCSICFNKEKEIVVLSCNHVFCRPCLNSYFSIQINDGVTEITCPQIGCKREVILKDLEQILPFSELKKLKRFRNAKNPNIRFCPKCDNPNSKEQAPLQYSTENEMECSKCHHKYCFFHSDAHPLTVSCESYEQVLRQSPEEIQTSKLLSETTKPCPGCQRPVELSEGCPLVKCSGCKLKWCYQCGKADLTGKYLPSCRNCGLEFIDHDYIWMWLLIFGLTAPIWLPLAIIYSLFISFLGCLCCGWTCIFMDSEGRTRLWQIFILASFLPFFIIFSLCGWIFCLPKWIQDPNANEHKV